jgi:YidC/Oxa1 family membrane protein insertase
MAVAPGARKFEGDTKELIIKFESPEAGGVKLVKTYTLKRDGYDIAVKHEVVNTSYSARCTAVVFANLA